jgi:hypothetical protein
VRAVLGALGHGLHDLRWVTAVLVTMTETVGMGLTLKGSLRKAVPEISTESQTRQVSGVAVHPDTQIGVGSR